MTTIIEKQKITKDQLKAEMGVDTSVLENAKNHVSLSDEDRQRNLNRDREGDRGREREEIRKSLIDAHGPLFIPEHMKDKNYRYYWEVLDSNMPFKFQQALDLGYEFVTISEMKSLRSILNKSSNKSSYIQDDERIGCGVGKGKIQYLLKIKKDRFDLMQEIRSEEADAFMINALEEQMHQGNAYNNRVSIQGAESKNLRYKNKE